MLFPVDHPVHALTFVLSLPCVSLSGGMERSQLSAKRIVAYSITLIPTVSSQKYRYLR